MNWILMYMRFYTPSSMLVGLCFISFESISQTICNCKQDKINEYKIDSADTSNMQIGQVDSSDSMRLLGQIDTVLIKQRFMTQVVGKQFPNSNPFEEVGVFQRARLSLDANYVKGSTFQNPNGQYSRLRLNMSVTLFKKLPLEVDLSLLYSHTEYRTLIRPIATTNLDQQRFAKLGQNDQITRSLQPQIDDMFKANEMQSLVDFDTWQKDNNINLRLQELKDLEEQAIKARYQYIRVESDSMLQIYQDFCEKSKPLCELKSRYDSLTLAVKASQDRLQALTNEVNSPLKSAKSKLPDTPLNQWTDKLLKLKLGLHSIPSKSLIAGQAPINGLSFQYKRNDWFTSASVGMQQNWRNMLFDFDALTNSFGNSQFIGYAKLEKRQKKYQTSIEIMSAGNYLQTTNVSMQRNLVASINGNYKLTKAIDLDASYAYTLSRTAETELLPNQQRQPDAFVFSLHGRVNKHFGLKGTYRQVAPLFYSQANPFLVSNQRRLNLQIQTNWLRGKLQIQGGYMPTEPVTRNESEILLQPTVSFSQWNALMIAQVAKHHTITSSYMPVNYVIETRYGQQAQEFGMALLGYQFQKSDYYVNVSVSNLRTALFLEDTTQVRKGFFSNVNVTIPFSKKTSVKCMGFSDMPSDYNQNYQKDRFAQASIVQLTNRFQLELGIDYLQRPAMQTPFLGGLCSISTTLTNAFEIGASFRYRYNTTHDAQYFGQVQMSYLIFDHHKAKLNNG